MHLEEALYTYLSTYAGLIALTSTRIYPEEKPQNCIMPAVVYSRISTPREHTMGTDPGLASPRFQFTIYDTNHKNMLDVKAQIKAALQDYSGVMGGAGGVTVQAVILDDENAGYDAETKQYYTDVDYIIWHLE